MLNDPIEESISVREANRRRKLLAAGPRRKYSLDFKLKILQETTASGASVASVALRHNINTNVVFRWRKLYREGRLGDGVSGAKALPPPALVPVRVTEREPVPVASPPPPAKPAPRKKRGTMTITMPGGFTLRVEEGIDDAALRAALRAVMDLS